MRLERIYCEQFRRLTRVAVEPAPGLNVFFGGNAQGKTSLLEAVLYAATARSHRATGDRELVQHGADGFFVAIAAVGASGKVEVEARWWQGQKRFRINGATPERLSDLLGRVQVVLFAPDDLELVKGPASVRRRFLDICLSRIHGRYLRALQAYRQSLRQRNALLKGSRPDPTLLDSFDALLARDGATLARDRADWITRLDAVASALYQDLAEQRETLRLRYVPDIRDLDHYLDVLGRSRESDLKAGATTRGPHRDEVQVLVDDHPLDAYGSQGQQKSAALALRLAEAQLTREACGEAPALLLDEIFSDLDERRSERVLDAVPPDAQALVTTARPLETLPRRLQDARLFHVRDGEVSSHE
ncbi:MAG TPA: DNA replication/repair protein RecF [Candidatus Hydrogenedentes bacterium]|nr:DNA replication/repair protein RecF [Candidatus Hydrogenedentota bacterium]HOK90393.1 DNA replication/repair protein RecF [Candidatus Hydrogenedentota bacterium]